MKPRKTLTLSEAADRVREARAYVSGEGLDEVEALLRDLAHAEPNKSPVVVLKGDRG